MMIFFWSKYKSLIQLLMLMVFILTACTNQNIIETGQSTSPAVNSNLIKTQTGFYWPTGVEISSEDDNWLASGCNEKADYFKDKYHIGQDIAANKGDGVFAISDGEVLSVSKNDWGSGNVALLIMHQLINGDRFIAVYGHIQTQLEKGDFVTGGTSIGTVGHWDAGNHLHFGIRPGTDITAPYGRMPCPYEGNTNGFVNPILWVTSNTPSPMIGVSSMELSQSPTDEESSIQSQSGYSQNDGEVPSDIPIPSDAYNFYYVFLPPYSLDPLHDEKCSEFQFWSNLPHKDLENFYLVEMSKMNWKLVGQEKLRDDISYFYFEKGNQKSGIFINSYPTRFFGKVTVNFNEWYYSGNCKKIANDIPIPSDLRGNLNNGFIRSYSPEQDSTSIGYRTPYTQKEVADFYLNQLPIYGWSFVCISSNYEELETIYIQFEKPGREPPRPDFADTDQIYIEVGLSTFDIGRTVVNIGFIYEGENSPWESWCGGVNLSP